ncbi:MAG TPA: transglutaminase-like domain-containing protein [Anaerolineales bacterium]|nr:transglutaminase-like domain-containing protein [Anaerolineales bacterium]
MSLSAFATQSATTTPGALAAHYTGLPTGVAALRDVVQGLMVHVFWAQAYGLTLSPERQGEVQLRWVERQLERILELDPRPLTDARPGERKLVGNCRDYSTLLASFLRHQGVPARARCGFGAYFEPGRYEDHWVCEYWNAEQRRWVLVDAQLDALQREKLAIAFDPLDVPRDAFIVGGDAWRMCREGRADPEAFGIFDMKGLWFVRGDFVRDVAALNKVETLPWDGWGLVDTRDDELTPDDLALLDRLAVLTAGQVPEYAAVRALYANDDRLRVPRAVNSYVDNEVRIIELAS